MACTGEHISGLLLTPMYFSKALWLLKLFCVSSVLRLLIFSSCDTLKVVLPWHDIVIQLKDARFFSIIFRDFYRKTLLLVSSKAINPLVPNLSESSTCKRIIPYRCGPSIFRIRHVTEGSRCVPRLSRWWVMYVRYQWRPYYGIPYSGFTTLSMNPGGRSSSGGSRMNMALSRFV